MEVSNQCHMPATLPWGKNPWHSLNSTASLHALALLRIQPKIIQLGVAKVTHDKPIRTNPTTESYQEDPQVNLRAVQRVVHFT